MRKMLLAAMLALVSMGVVAQPAYYIANEIPYAEKDKIAQRVVNGCTRLGTDFSTYMVKRGQAYGVDIKRAKGDLVEYPDRIVISIDVARSYGNLMIGHYKATYVDVVLFENNVKIKEAKLSRSSIGGVFGMFKSSCGVLNRVNSVLSKDIVRWVMKPSDVPADSAEAQAEISPENSEGVPLLPINY
jgi:hypothetical protein